MKKFKFNKKTLKKFVLVFIIPLLLIYSGVILYSFIFEKEKIAIDKYNFGQLEKAIPILEGIPSINKRFHRLSEFQEKYAPEIEPIKNCYYVSNYNGDADYIFAFQLESLMYKLLYFRENYAYPKNNIGKIWSCT